MKERPNLQSSAEKELDKVEKQFEAFDQNIKDMTLDRMNEAPKKEMELQTKISQKDMEKSDDIYLKPHRQIGCREKFNEKYREDYNFAMEYVRFIPENKEINGETIELWTRPFPGMPAQEWKIPCGKPVWGPRHLAERISNCKYHRFVMQQSVNTGSDNKGNQYFGAMAVDTTIQRLDAVPVNERKSIFMGKASGF
jgi:hypothetical protein